MSPASDPSANLELVRTEVLRACAAVTALILIVQVPWLRGSVELLVPLVPFFGIGVLLCVLGFEWIGSRMSPRAHERLYVAFTLLLGLVLGLTGPQMLMRQTLATALTGGIGVAAWFIAPMLRVDLSGPNSPVASVTTLVRVTFAVLLWLPPLPTGLRELLALVFVAIWSTVLLRDIQAARFVARHRVMRLNSWEVRECVRRVLFALAIVQLSLRDALQRAF